MRKRTMFGALLLVSAAACGEDSASAPDTVMEAGAAVVGDGGLSNRMDASSNRGDATMPGDVDGSRPDGSGTASDGGKADGSTGANKPDAGADGLGLRVEGNKILGPDGKPFHGRGANLADTRSCDACTYQAPNVQGLNRWSDQLLDVWKANFVRFTLTSFPQQGGRVHWKSVTQDPAYVADIKTAVTHMTDKQGVYVMVTLFKDPSMKDDNGDYDSEWPTAQTNAAYKIIAEQFWDNPKVLFALTNEPHGPSERDAELAQRYLSAIDTIRAVEKAHNAAEHVIVVQAPTLWARYLDYFLAKPIARTNIAYEVHVYNQAADFGDLLREPSKKLPIIVGEHGPVNDTGLQMSDDDVRAMWALCKELEIPHLAWIFHMRCSPDLLQDTASDGCGLAASTGYNFPRTAWGNMFYDYLKTPW